MKIETTEETDELNLITLAQEYNDEDKARGLLESLLWPQGAVCPHCKNHKEKAIYKLQSKEGSKTKIRKGVYKCGACRKPFTVRLERFSRLPIFRLASGSWRFSSFARPRNQSARIN